MDDEADGREIVNAVGGIIRCVPDVPKDKTKRYDSYQYEYIVRVYDESEQGPALAPKKARERNYGEELSVMVNLDCQFHYQFDKTHMALPWEQNGWQVTHVYFPKVKLAGGGSTGDRAPIAILKMRPPDHWNNERDQGLLFMEEAGRLAQLPRRIHLEIPFQGCLLYTSPSPRDGW